MLSWDAITPVLLKPSGPVTEAFLTAGVLDYQKAARYVSQLAYGRNSNPSEPLIVLRERRGTCSTKHALIRRLALEQELDVALAVGIYQMTAQNTPGVGEVLRHFGLASLPEAHCYLRADGKRIDITWSQHASSLSAEDLVYEEEISPGQIGEYKTTLHQRFLRKWMKAAQDNRFSFEELWGIREECIAALGNAP